MAANRKPLVDGPDISNPTRTSATAITGLVATPMSLQNLGLNYFDGRFLRADDLNLERAAQRAYVDVGRRAGGQGIGDGLNLEASGTQLRLSGGTAIDSGGRLVSLDGIGWTEFAVIASSAAAPAGSLSAPAAGAYVVRIAREPQLAGNADVLGRVCDCGCGSIMDKPIAVDGVRIWADPLPALLLPSLPGVTDPVKHARSQIASAYFGYERDQLWTPLSGPGLALATWCVGEPVNTGSDAGANGVDIGVVYWNGSTVSWYDDWTVRRELMETRPRRYWAGLTEERPWSVFMAQVLQFQCQLADEPALLRGRRQAPARMPSNVRQRQPPADFSPLASSSCLRPRTCRSCRRPRVPSAPASRHCSAAASTFGSAPYAATRSRTSSSAPSTWSASPSSVV